MHAELPSTRSSVRTGSQEDHAEERGAPAGGFLMARGYKTGGRQRGTPNKKTAQLLAYAAKGGETPLDFLLRVMRSPKVPWPVRVQAAATAAPYLSSEAAGHPDGGRQRSQSRWQRSQDPDRRRIGWRGGRANVGTARFICGEGNCQDETLNAKAAGSEEFNSYSTMAFLQSISPTITAGAPAPLLRRPERNTREQAPRESHR